MVKPFLSPYIRAFLVPEEVQDGVVHHQRLFIALDVVRLHVLPAAISYRRQRRGEWTDRRLGRTLEAAYPRFIGVNCTINEYKWLFV